MAEEKEEKKSDERVKIKVVEEEEQGQEEKTPLRSSFSSKLKLKKSSDKPEESTDDTEEESKVETVKKSQPENVETEKKRSLDNIPFWILFIAFIFGLTIGAGLIGGIFYYKTNVEKIQFDQETPEPQATTSPKPIEATPEPKKEVDISKLKYQVLNGSGEKGSAGKVESILTDAGIESIETGNADNYNYENTVIAYKDTLEKAEKEEIKSLLKDYQTEEAEDTLDKNFFFDVKIIVGAN